jgi:hypothetical protein
MAGTEASSNYERQILQKIPHLKLTYEDNLLHATSHQETADQIFDWLNIDSVSVKADLQKMMPFHLSEMVENYEELYQAIQTTKYAHYLESE